MAKEILVFSLLGSYVPSEIIDVSNGQMHVLLGSFAHKYEREFREAIVCEQLGQRVPQILGSTIYAFARSL